MAQAERMLSDAGFKSRPADTPAARTLLRSLPRDQLLQHGNGSDISYVYADPELCGCLYIGTPASFDRYRRALDEHDLAERRKLIAVQPRNPGFDLGSFGIGPAYHPGFDSY